MSGTAKEAERAQKARLDNKTKADGEQAKTTQAAKPPQPGGTERFPTGSLEDQWQPAGDQPDQPPAVNAEVSRGGEDAQSVGRTNNERFKTEQVLAGKEP